ncbi:hypothetical protein OG264_38130 [Streptomyces xanthophaeus]|uniref:hypothetical protein n=1 Tax=Streptomyces xanthophaeus TaxID=67385 RepID=UPI0038695454|nr:hypothetical protein OG264_38130 [Streptomyces xanthophaeus]WST65489.1 hypothetical protein OG605_00305 [Streptomyces xanthophaeus]
MNGGGRFHRRHLLAEARRHLALVLVLVLVLRGRRREPGLGERIVAAAISTHCLDISEPKTVRGLEAGYRFYTARWALSDLPARRRPPTPAPDPHRQPPAHPGQPAAPRHMGQEAGERGIPRIQQDPELLEGDRHDLLVGGALSLWGAAGGEVGCAAGQDDLAFCGVEALVVERGQDLASQRHRASPCPRAWRSRRCISSGSVSLPGPVMRAGLGRRCSITRGSGAGSCCSASARAR